MERSFDLKATACFLPDLKIRKYRSISASMENDEENEESGWVLFRMWKNYLDLFLDLVS